MTFELANKLAETALELDEMKDRVPGFISPMAINVVEELHLLARAVAGARAGEIYDLTEQKPNGTETTCV